MDVADQPTCGQGLAHNSTVPATLAELTAALAANLEEHVPALDLEDPAARAEHEVYERVARRLRAGAEELGAAAREMAGARDLPMGRHDMRAMTGPENLQAFERYVGVEEELLALLDARREQDRGMLAAMREAIAAAGG
jgi:hypothetical protein